MKCLKENLVNSKEIEKDFKKWEKLEILSEVELLVAQKRKRNFKISKKDLESFTL